MAVEIHNMPLLSSCMRNNWLSGKPFWMVWLVKLPVAGSYLLNPLTGTEPEVLLRSSKIVDIVVDDGIAGVWLVFG